MTVNNGDKWLQIKYNSNKSEFQRQITFFVFGINYNMYKSDIFCSDEKHLDEDKLS